MPFQYLLSGFPVEVFRLAGFSDSSSGIRHRHGFYMLLYVTEGTGTHEVNFREVELLPGRLLFLMEGHVHRVIDQVADGWMVLFHASVFRLFMDRYVLQEQAGLFDYMNRKPFVDLDEGAVLVFDTVMPLLEQAVTAESATAPETENYLFALLWRANRLYVPVHPLAVHPDEAEQVRQLKKLIKLHFIGERFAPFYADRLGMVPRKLNELCRRLTGRLVQDLVSDRLLSEAEALLGGTALSVKEIAFELGFMHQAHFGFFFRKQKGISPGDFRKSLAHPR